MTVIDSDAECITLINTFVVRPENQDELVDLLEEATERTMRFRPGFVSANIHKSLDGKRVVNYAQWRSRADFEAMQADPACREHMDRAAGLAERVEPALYQVASTHESRLPGSFQMSPELFVSL